MPIKYGANGLHDGTDETKELAFDVTGVTTGTTRTVTVPDKSGTLAMTSDIPAGGKVLQVVHATSDTESSTTSTSFVDSNLSASITPSSTSNKIVALFSIPGYAAVANTHFVGSLFRGNTSTGTNLGSSPWGHSSIFNNQGEITGVVSSTVLDNPATTSSVTYTVGFKSNTGNSVSAMINQCRGTLTLMEIAG